MTVRRSVNSFSVSRQHLCLCWWLEDYLDSESTLMLQTFQTSTAVKLNQLWTSGSRCVFSNKLCRLRIRFQTFLDCCKRFVSSPFCSLISLPAPPGEEQRRWKEEKEVVLTALPFPGPAAGKWKHAGAWSDGTLKRLQARFIIPKSSITALKCFPL